MEDQLKSKNNSLTNEHMRFFLLTLLVLIFSNGLMAQSNPETIKQNMEDLHWIIERSSIETIQEKFDAILKENGLPFSKLQLTDGKYQGESPYDDYKYKHVVSFEVKDGKITSLDYNEVHEDGHAKQEDKDYCEKMSITGTTPAIAYPIYEKKMMKTQDMEKLDAVSGATYSLYRFKLAMAYAILNAQKD